MSSIFKKTILISLFGHLAVFGMFTFSFGPVVPVIDYAPGNFLGRILTRAEFTPPFLKPTMSVESGIIRILHLPVKEVTALSSSAMADYYVKPPLYIGKLEEKESFVLTQASPIAPLIRKEPVIIFHPVLPYDLRFYLKDRQVAHVELSFQVTPHYRGSSITINRKISSGNLEVDLLSMRYIEKYLFMQQARFSPGNWQAVKIDLSAEND